MSLLNRFYTKTREFFGAVGEKAEALVDGASKSVKIKSLEIKIDEQYEKLGELVYRDCHVDEDLEEEKLAIIAAIDALFDKLSLLKGEEDCADDVEAADTADAE